jgi:PilZ domain
MTDRTSKDAERRRSTRFSCGGQAKVTQLPSNGIFIPGTLRDLSLHGCCLDTSLPVDNGMRAEILLRVNTASFRAVGEVKGVRRGTSAGVEFVQLSAGGKDLLAELVEELERLQALMLKLKSARREMDAASFRREMTSGKFAAMLSQRFPILGAILNAESAEAEVADTSDDAVVRAQPLVVSVDLFG